MMTLTIGFCLLISEFASDIEEKLRQINQDVVIMNDKNPTIDEKFNLTMKLYGIIQFHIEARELSVIFYFI